MREKITINGGIKMTSPEELLTDDRKFKEFTLRNMAEMEVCLNSIMNVLFQTNTVDPRTFACICALITEQKKHMFTEKGYKIQQKSFKDFVVTAEKATKTIKKYTVKIKKP